MVGHLWALHDSKMEVEEDKINGMLLFVRLREQISSQTDATQL